MKYVLSLTLLLSLSSYSYAVVEEMKEVEHATPSSADSYEEPGTTSGDVSPAGETSIKKTNKVSRQPTKETCENISGKLVCDRAREIKESTREESHTDSAKASSEFPVDPNLE
jgi:hypothetical protein